MAVSKNTRSTKAPAATPVTAGISVSLFPQRLRQELDAAHLAMDQTDSFIHVCNLALRQQDCDVDGDVAAVLDAAYGKVTEARNAIMNALDVLQEVSHG